MTSNNWWKFNIEILKDNQELFSNKLAEMGISTYVFNMVMPFKSEVNIRKLTIWLPEFKWTKIERENFENIFLNLDLDKYPNTSDAYWEFISEEDWLIFWKKNWDHKLIGRDFLILPFWMVIPKKYYDKKVIKIKPFAVFGTGIHPSTSLCLNWIENNFMKKKKVLDIGCGSGILTIASKISGAIEVHAVDNDYLAIHSTKENFKLNFDDYENLNIYQGFFQEISRTNSLRDFDIVFCNVALEVMKKIIPFLNLVLVKKGYLILSGILLYEVNDILVILQQYDFNVVNTFKDGKWICIEALKKNF